MGFVVLQIFPAKVIGIPTQDIGANPPERFPFDGPPEVEAIMRRACFDCHTNETRWPLYARIAPGSWLMARDIHNGRNHLNFSKWADSDEDERQTDRENCLGADRIGRDAALVLHPALPPGREAVRRRQGDAQGLLPEEQEGRRGADKDADKGDAKAADAAGEAAKDAPKP